MLCALATGVVYLHICTYVFSPSKKRKNGQNQALQVLLVYLFCPWLIKLWDVAPVLSLEQVFLVRFLFSSQRPLSSFLQSQGVFPYLLMYLSASFLAALS